MTLRRRVALVPAAAAACGATALSACHELGTGSRFTEIVSVDSMQVSSQEAAPAADRTYEYTVPNASPDSVLTALYRAGIVPGQAWRPLDYRCEDPIGPRLTVQLGAPDGRMLAHDFVLGTGRLACADRLMKYWLNIVS